MSPWLGIEQLPVNLFRLYLKLSRHLICLRFAFGLYSPDVIFNFAYKETSMPTDSTLNPAIIEQARQELLALHAAERQAHFATDVEAMVAPLAETFIDVRDGTLQRVVREDRREDFKHYFQNSTYQEWDDVEPPIVQVAHDASLGWMITQVKVRRTLIDEDGVTQVREFIYAGILTYKKREGQWVCTANVSTTKYLKIEP